MADRTTGLTPNRWRSDPKDGRSAGTLSQFVRETLAARGGACTRAQLYDSILADGRFAERVEQRQGISGLLDYMRRSGFIEIEGELIRRTRRVVGRPNR